MQVSSSIRFTRCKVHFELWQPHPGQVGFSLYESCVPGSLNYEIADKVAGPLDPDREYAVLLGHCPAVLDNGIIRAKTLLLPGMIGTPEYDLCLRPLAKTIEARKDVRLRAGMTAFRCLEETGECALLKEFHENGFPLVRSFDHAIVAL